MSLSAQAPNGTRWWLILSDPARPPTSVQKPETIPDSCWDSPCVFSTDRATAWQVAVTNEGQFYTQPAPLSRAQFEYIEFLGTDRVSRLLRFNNLGDMVTT